jgi:hypothetical protein
MAGSNIGYVGVRYTADQLRWLNAKAEALDRPVAWVLRRMVQDALDAGEPAPDRSRSPRPQLLRRTVHSVKDGNQ